MSRMSSPGAVRRAVMAGALAGALLAGGTAISFADNGNAGHHGRPDTEQVDENDSTVTSTATATTTATPTDDQDTDNAAQTPRPLTDDVHQLHGVVKSVASSTSFVVTDPRFGDVTVNAEPAATVTATATTTATATATATSTPDDQDGPNGDGNGNGHGHGPRGNPRSFLVTDYTHLAVGDRVLVLGQVTSTSPATFQAEMVRVLPSHPRTMVVRGTVTGTSTTSGQSSITIQPRDGAAVTIPVTTSTEFRPDGTTLASLTNGSRVVVLEAQDGSARFVLLLPSEQ